MVESRAGLADPKQAPEGEPAPPRERPLRLMFVVPWELRLDARHGGRVIAQLLLRLAERHRVAVVHLAHPEARRFDPALEQACDLVEAVPPDHAGLTSEKWRRRRATLASPITGRPLPVAALYSRALTEACVRIATDWSPDVIQVEHDNLAYCGPALAGAGLEAASVLVCHEPGPLASADQAAAAHGRRRAAHRLEVALWRRYWARTLPAFDAIVALTNSDLEVIGSAVEGPRLVRIGLGIDMPGEALSPEGTEDILFVGGYRHPPNADAALRLLRSILPMVRERLPGATLTLVGAEPGDALREAASPLDTITGTVPSVNPFLDRAGVFVLPIRLGGGMRVKLLEALAAGKAVVASPLAAAGLDAGEGVLEMAETDDEFAEAIVRLLRDPSARARLGRNARAWAVDNLGWDGRVRQYEQLYRSLLARDSGDRSR